MVELVLQDNTRIQVEKGLQEMTAAFQLALKSKQVIEIKRPDGNKLSINPYAILYFETKEPSDKKEDL